MLLSKWLTVRVRKAHVKMPSGAENDDYYVLEYSGWIHMIASTEDSK